MALSPSDLMRLLESLRTADGIATIRVLCERILQELIEAEAPRSSVAPPASTDVGPTSSRSSPTPLPSTGSPPRSWPNSSTPTPTEDKRRLPPTEPNQLGQ